LVTLNGLIELEIIKDYAIGGGYAVMYYDIPLTTYDLDVLVLLSDEEDFHKLYEHFRKEEAKVENVYIYINEMPVQFLPNYISPLFNGAIEKANEIEFDGVHSKVVSIEHLIALLLTAFRAKDRMRLQGLIKKANKRLLTGILKKYDDGQHTLYKRYRQVLAGAQ
jgi:predicted nucleotidyltransferase